MTPRANRSSGFTLIELLVAMSLFTMLGLAVVLMMRTGTDLYLRGSQGSQQQDRIEQTLPRLGEDLRATHVPPARDRIPFDPKNPDPQKEPLPVVPDVRFLSAYQDYKVGSATVPCRYLAFVRELAGLPELEVYAARAGMNPQADAYIDGKNDEQEFEHFQHMPTGGLLAVLWIWVPDPDHPGLGTVERAYKSPVGGPNSLLDPGNYDTLRKLQKDVQPQPIFQDVLLFDLSFWTQYTTTWKWSPGEPSVTQRPSAKQALQPRPECGPSLTWDSTRGLLAPDVFRLCRGPDSARFTEDDIWPRRVHVQLALKESESTLATSVGATDGEFVVESPEFASGFGNLSHVYMKIGYEWVLVRSRSSAQRDHFLVESRGCKGTTATAHAAGTPVYFGRILDSTIEIPAFRDDLD